MAAPKLDAVAAILARAAKSYNGLTAGAMDDIAEGTTWLSTGNLAIDNAIGGGIPLRRSVELSGPPSCGKTTTALQTAVELQKVIIAGGDPSRGIGPKDIILYLDYEQAMDRDYAESLGLQTNHPSLIFTQPDTLEDGANFCLELIKTGRVRLSIFDSVASMNPSARAEAEVGSNRPGLQARLLKEFGVNLNTALSNHNSSVIFINHEVEKFDMGGAKRPGMPTPTTTPGGLALKYFASVRVSFKQIRQIKGPYVDQLSGEVVEIPVATDVKVKVLKNKVAPPFREAMVRVRFGKGFDNFWTALQVLQARKKIMHQAGMFYFHNVADIGLAPEWMARAATGTQRPYIKGEGNVFKMADKNPEWRKQIIELAEKVVAENIAPSDEDEEELDEDGESEEDDDSNPVTGSGRRMDFVSS